MAARGGASGATAGASGAPAAGAGGSSSADAGTATLDGGDEPRLPVDPGGRRPVLPAVFPGTILIDYGDPGYAEGGTWQNEEGSYYNAGQSWTAVRATTTAGSWASWTPAIPKREPYRVFLWHLKSNDSAATIEVASADGVKTIKRNMQSGFNLGWEDLGTYTFDVGNQGHVKVTRGNGEVLVDAVKLVPAATWSKPPLLPAYPPPDGSFPHVDPAHRGTLLLSGRPYQILYQETLDDSTDTPDDVPYLDQLFDTALAQGVNTLGTILHWNDYETAEGTYDHRVIDALIERAKARNMHLSLVLFWGFRNLASNYVPAYVARDKTKYPFNGRGMSPFCDACLEREKAALADLATEVKAKDPDHQVVVAVQLENEMPASRERSTVADAAFARAVPAELLTYLASHERDVSPWLQRVWSAGGKKTAGTWATVFGDSNDANKVFAVYSMGLYEEALLRAAKAVLPVPMYCNAWIGESPCWPDFMDVFHVAAPSFDGMGPDSYNADNQDAWERNVAAAVRPWNSLVVPEQHQSIKSLWRAIAKYDAFLSGQYWDVEGGEWLKSQETYALVTEMMPVMMPKKGTGDLLGFYQNQQKAGASWTEPFDDLTVKLTPTVDHAVFKRYEDGHPGPQPTIDNRTGGELDGCGLIMKLGSGDYVITSTRIDVELARTAGNAIDVRSAETGRFERGQWTSEGAATVDRAGSAIRIAFPKQNRKYAQVRVVLAN